jgi:hypothetical protein
MTVAIRNHLQVASFTNGLIERIAAGRNRPEA